MNTLSKEAFEQLALLCKEMDSLHTEWTDGHREMIATFDRMDAGVAEVKTILTSVETRITTMTASIAYGDACLARIEHRLANTDNNRLRRLLPPS